EREPLVESADRHRALAEEAERDVAVAAVLARERGADGERDVSADDAVAPEHAVLRVEEVHRSAEALAAPRDLAEQFCDHLARRHALRDGDAVVTVRGHGVIAGLRRRDRADADGLLADVQVEEAA